MKCCYRETHKWGGTQQHPEQGPGLGRGGWGLYCSNYRREKLRPWLESGRSGLSPAVPGAVGDLGYSLLGDPQPLIWTHHCC